MKKALLGLFVVFFIYGCSSPTPIEPETKTETVHVVSVVYSIRVAWSGASSWNATGNLKTWDAVHSVYNNTPINWTSYSGNYKYIIPSQYTDIDITVSINSWGTEYLNIYLEKFKTWSDGFTNTEQLDWDWGVKDSITSQYKTASIYCPLN